MLAHARLAPSSAYRWIRCPGSVALCENLPDTTSEYAAEGSVAHHVRETCLVLGLPVETFVGKTFNQEGFKITVEESWVKYLQPGIDRINEFKGELFVENRVDWSLWGTKRPDCEFGTLDVGIVGRRLIVIDDLKFGQGVPVEVEGNEQMLIYGLGFYSNIAKHKTDAEELLLRIDQPRVEGRGGEWRISLSDLKDFGRDLRIAAAATYEEDASLVFGSVQCRFCPAAEAGICSTFHRKCMELTGLRFEDLDGGKKPVLKDPEEMTPKRRAFLVKHADLIKKWLGSLYEITLNDAVSGRPTPGLKAVQGRSGPRFWKDEDKADEILTEILGTKRFTKKLKSPTQVEDALSPSEMKRVSKLIGQTKGKPSLVPIESKKGAVTTTKTLFKNLNA